MSTIDGRSRKLAFARRIFAKALEEKRLRIELLVLSSGTCLSNRLGTRFTFTRFASFSDTGFRWPGN
jgi:hypothetical protein